MGGGAEVSDHFPEIKQKNLVPVLGAQTSLLSAKGGGYCGLNQDGTK